MLPHLRAGNTDLAVSDPGGTFTYEELAAAVARLTESLTAHGVRAGDRVVVHTRLTRWAVVGMLAVLCVGGQYIPVDAGFPAQRQHAMISASRARVAVVEPDHCYPVLSDEFEGVLVIEPTAILRAPEVTPVAAGAPAYSMFTSGSTGRPKRVEVSRGALGHSTAARFAYYPDPPSTFLLCSSISFDSSVAGIYWTLAAGAHLAIPSTKPGDVIAIAQAARTLEASHVLLIPSLYRLLLEIADDVALASLRTVIVAGEVCPPELVGRHYEELPGAVLYNEYGPTECTVWSLVHECAKADATATDVAIGRAVPGVEILVRVGDRAARVDEPGELWIGGPVLANGYPDEPAGESAFAVVNGTRMYRTGDMVRVSDTGLAHFIGRRDLQVKLGGARIELAEVEQRLQACSGAAAVAVGVVGRPTPEFLVGFVVGPGTGSDTPTVRRKLAEVLPGSAVPRLIRFVDTLPTLPNGKVDRNAVNEMSEQWAAKDGLA